MFFSSHVTVFNKTFYLIVSISHFQELDTFGERLKNVSKVLDMVVKQKGK